MLVRISDAMAQVAHGFLRRLALTQAATGDQFVNQVWRADGHLGKEFRTIEQPGQQFKNCRIAVPQLEQSRPRAVRADEAIKPSDDSVGIGQWFERRIPRFEDCLSLVTADVRRRISSKILANFRLVTSAATIFRTRSQSLARFWAKREQFWQQPVCQFARTRRNVNISRPLHKLTQ